MTLSKIILRLSSSHHLVSLGVSCRCKQRFLSHHIQVTLTQKLLGFLFILFIVFVKMMFEICGKAFLQSGSLFRRTGYKNTLSTSPFLSVKRSKTESLFLLFKLLLIVFCVGNSETIRH